jgi:hypothetical protein
MPATALMCIPYDFVARRFFTHPVARTATWLLNGGVFVLIVPTCSMQFTAPAVTAMLCEDSPSYAVQRAALAVDFNLLLSGLTCAVHILQQRAQLAQLPVLLAAFNRSSL